MNWKPIQRRLGVTPDGVAGPITMAALFQRMAGWPMGEVARVMGASAAKHFPAYAINTPERLAHWFSQWGHESGGFRKFEENLSYTAERMAKVWPGRFRTVEAARPYARNPEALANLVYGGRMGNTQPGDGWRFRGRGPGLTGRTNYTACAARTGLDLVGNPGLAADPAHFVHIACDFWQQCCLNALADNDDLRGITKRINGGLIGLEDRKDKLAKAREILL